MEERKERSTDTEEGLNLIHNTGISKRFVKVWSCCRAESTDSAEAVDVLYALCVISQLACLMG